MWHLQTAHLFTCVIIWLSPGVKLTSKEAAGRRAIKTLWIHQACSSLGYNAGILCQSSKSLVFQSLRKMFKYIQNIPPAAL